VLFASLIDDPDQDGVPLTLLEQIDQLPTTEAHGPEWATLSANEQRRRKLFQFIGQLVLWENSTNAEVLDTARELIRASTEGRPPLILDPFCGGGSIPLEAQRLGLEVGASDLNPVAVLITKALIEIPSHFAGQPPVSPQLSRQLPDTDNWTGAKGLAEDVRYYGKWMRDQAKKRISHLYPQVTLRREQGGGEATVVAWLWARTVICPNPACRARMPLVRSFWLSIKPGKKAWVEPVVNRASKTIHFEVRTGQGTPPNGTVNRRGATCIVCGTPVPFDHIRSEGKAGRMSAQMMAIIAEGSSGRIYLDPSEEHSIVSTVARPDWEPSADLPDNPRDFKTPNYGLRSFFALFTPRQLVALTTFSDLVGEAREQVRKDAIAAGLSDDGVPFVNGGDKASAYADIVVTYLAFAISRLSDYGSTLATWRAKDSAMRSTLAKQALPMVWDYAEGNPFGSSSAGFAECTEVVARCLRFVPALPGSSVQQFDAAQRNPQHAALVATDPPYYDNIGYADLSDFFYVWLRRSLGQIYPQLFGTLLTPKSHELIASRYRFGGNEQKAREFFEEGLGNVFEKMRMSQSPEYPLTVYYAFKQAETDEGDDDSGGAIPVASTGWETMLAGLLTAGFVITGTWPLRTEGDNRQIGNRANALASSIVLVCRPRPADAPLTTRREFLNALKRELPEALKKLQHGNIAPVDLAQATIGPGMAVFSRYSCVMEVDGSPMHVRTALQLINQALDEVLTEQEGEFDSDTRWALAWFEQFGTGEGLYGVAEMLSKAKNTSITGLVEAGLLAAKGGKVRLLRRDELSDDWDPSTDKRLTVWETAQHLIRALDRDGETGAAALLAKMGERGQVARDLAYRLYTLCERKDWAEEALAYNSLVIAWQGIGQLASRQTAETPRQQEMFS